MHAALDFATQTEIFRRFQAADPAPAGELEHSDAFTLLVAVVLSAQATDAGVNKATRGLFARASTPAAMLALGEAGLVDAIKTIALSQILRDRYAGRVPDSRAALQALPGVGRKTANVVLNIAFGVASQAVDTHVFRVANRTGIAPGRDVLAVERALEDNIPARFQRHAHHWLILHGRYICTARKPRCGDCLLRDLCLFEEKTP